MSVLVLLLNFTTVEQNILIFYVVWVCIKCEKSYIKYSFSHSWE